MIAGHRVCSGRRMTSKQYATALTAYLGVGAVLMRRARQLQAINFSCRSVLISGGSRGLGFVIARPLAREGADVTLVGRDAEELARAQALLLSEGRAVTCLVKD